MLGGYYRCYMPFRTLIWLGLCQGRTYHDDMLKLESDRFIRPEVRATSRYGEMQEKAVFGNIEWADIVVLQRMGTGTALKIIDLAKRAGKPIVHECDDLCEDVPKGNPAHWYWRSEERLKLHRKCFEAADLVSTTNPRLAQWYREKYKQPVVVLPNQIDWPTTRWECNFKKGPGMILGYMGAGGHHVDVGVLREIFPALLEEFPDLMIEILGLTPDWAKDMDRVLCRTVSIVQVPEAISRWDVGLAPIIDHPFNVIGKSDIKFLEYSVAGIATVAANLKPYRGTIQQKATGLLARWDDPEDWLRKVGGLLRRAGYRQNLAAAARHWTLQNRTYAGNVHKWFQAYADLLAGHIRKEWKGPG